MRGILIGNRVILDAGTSSELIDSFFGTKQDGKLILSSEEALYLVEKGKIDVYEKGKKLTFNSLLRKFSKVKDFWTKYVVYRDLRDKGYIAKEALKYGGDFRVYYKGEKPMEEHSRWICIAIKDTDFIKPRVLSAIVRVTHTVRKKLLIAVVDKEDEVTYYELDWIKI